MADYRFGIEEEYFLADAATGRSPDAAAADRFHAAARASVLPAEPELLKGQIEVATKPATDVASARRALQRMRRGLARLAADQGLLLFAAGSHPLGEVARQVTTEKERYAALEAEFGLLAHRMMVCATHIHVEVPDPDARVPLLRRLTPFLPLFLALSVSSPYWQGVDSGLDGFRLAAFSEWPRMGLPELIDSAADYARLVERLVGAGMIKDASFLWWYIRPSARYPTIEMRICDSCTRIDDVVAIAALYRCLVRLAVRRPDLCAKVGPVERAICAENIWQAQRNGVRAAFVDAAAGGAVGVADTLEATLALVAEDADALGCADAVAATWAIVRDGTGADRQRATYQEAIAAGADPQTALRAVVAMLADTTRA